MCRVFVIRHMLLTVLLLTAVQQNILLSASLCFSQNTANERAHSQ